MVQVIFLPLEEGNRLGDPEQAEVNPDGTFHIRGRDGDGIRPGRYRVSVQQLDPYPNVDRLKNQFGDTNSPIVVDVTAGQNIDIDLARYAPQPKP
jgi:hypothetical protein